MLLGASLSLFYLTCRAANRYNPPTETMAVGVVGGCAGTNPGCLAGFLTTGDVTWGIRPSS